MKKYIFTDLACELYDEEAFGFEKITSNIQKKHIRVTEKAGESSIKKNYITYYTPKLWLLEDTDFFALRDSIASEIRNLIKNKCRDIPLNEEFSVLVVGIGNPELTPDALGAETVKKITVTRHIPHHSDRLCVSALVPDVTGNTGIESAELIQACSGILSPKVILVIDSLAARSSARLASTIQLSDCGIVPGSGIGRGKARIDEAKFKVPIISLGVPTVINSSTLIVEVLEKSQSSMADDKVRGLLEEGMGSYVTPKETDILLNAAAMLLSSAVDSALVSEA